MANLPPVFLDSIAREFPRDFLSLDPADKERYGRDWTQEIKPAPCAVALPRTTFEVSRLLRLCAAQRVPVVPSGGRTGLSGGAAAPNGELVVSLDRMNQMGPVDLLGDTVRVQAGATTQAVHEHVAARGLMWPVDFSAKQTSQIGGNIATNAGGARAVRYGTTRRWVLGLEVVLANGDVLDLNGALEKNNTGIDLRQIFIGSEGTLGIITQATLKLTRLPGNLNVFFFAVPDVPSVLALFQKARRGPFVLSACEFFTDRCLARLRRHRKVRAPFEAASEYYVLIEVEHGEPEVLDTWICSMFDGGLVKDGTLAQDPTQAAELWALREGISESLIATGVPHKSNVGLPIHEIPSFCAELEAALAAQFPQFELAMFGHVGDGNLHVNLMKPEGMGLEAFRSRAREAEQVIFGMVKAHHGSISAEHGIGLLKKAHLSFSRSPEEIALMRTVKRALDPANLMNPGKVVDP